MSHICEKCGKYIEQGHLKNCNIGVIVSHNKLYAPAPLKNSVFEQPAIIFDGNAIYLKSGAQPNGQKMTGELYEQNLEKTINYLAEKLKKFKEEENSRDHKKFGY